MSRVERVQKAYLWIAITCAGMGVMSSSGCSPFPDLPSGALWLLHPLLLLLGAVSGVLSLRRSEEIDRQRWRVAEDSTVTRGEREYAHKEAEGERRWAGVCFAGGPLMLGYWLAYQVHADSAHVEAHLLPVTGIAGFAIGLGVAKLLGGAAPRAG
ncbi:MAG: hypothetical protein P8Y44_14615 [Acidobacteriota bacterium]